MKRFFILLSLIFCNMVYADTINLHWLNYDGTSYQDSTCVIDSDLILPATPPTRYGYTFTGWKMSNYTPIEYLESTGTQYIDTGIKQTLYAQHLIIKGEFQFSSIDKQRLLGTDNNSGAYFLPLHMYNGYFASNIGGPGNDVLTKPADMNKHTFICDTANKRMVLDTYLYNHGSNSANLNFNIYLFCNNRNGSPEGCAKVKLYGLSFLTEEGSFVRDFIPVLDLNGTPCMYDRVTQQFFYNQGTGQFIAGPVITE